MISQMADKDFVPNNPLSKKAGKPGLDWKGKEPVVKFAFPADEARSLGEEEEFKESPSVPAKQEKVLAGEEEPGRKSVTLDVEPSLEEPILPEEPPLPEEEQSAENFAQAPGSLKKESFEAPVAPLAEKAEEERVPEEGEEQLVPEEVPPTEEAVAEEVPAQKRPYIIKVASVFLQKPVWQKWLPIGGGIILLGFLGFGGYRFGWPLLREGLVGLIFKPKEITLTYWGLWEPETVMQPLIEEFEKENPHITIQYLKQSPQTYRERLQSALARGEGPDIMRIHNTWIPMFKDELAALPEEVMSASEFEATFYPVARNSLRWEDRIYALPLEYDGLALFINEGIFAAAGEVPPRDWIELREKASKLMVLDGEGKIQIAGVALGTTNNVDHWSDILGLMVLQNKGSLTQSTAELSRNTLEYYTLFARVDRVWDETLPASTYAFATGKLAMYFGPSWRVFNLLEINPDLPFTIKPVPQLSESAESQVNWASFWVEAVSLKSENQEAAWDFLKFLAQKESLEKLYELEAKLRPFGEIYPRVEMADLLKDDLLVAPFLEEAATGRSWYLCSRTEDNGINDRMIKYYEDAVNKVLRGESAETAVVTLEEGVKQILGQYGVE